MPNIKQLDLPQLGLQPSEIGVEAVAAAARRGGAFFNQAAQSLDTLGQRVGGALRDAGDAAVKYMDHQQISAGSAAYADLLANSTVEWNQTAKEADPNDPSVAQAWREEKLEPRLQQFQSGFTTERSQAWAEAHVNQLRQHFAEKTRADMASMAADAVHMNAVKTLNVLSSTVYNDPSALDMSLKLLESTAGGVADSSPNLTPAVAAKVKSEIGLKGTEQIVKSAIMGAIAKGGDWRPIADKYSEFVTPAEAKLFEQQARSFERVSAQEDRSRKAQAQQDAVDELGARANDLHERTLPQTVDGSPVLPPDYWQKWREMKNLPGANTPAGRRILNEVENYGRAVTTRMNNPDPPQAKSLPVFDRLSKAMDGADGNQLSDIRNDIYSEHEQGNLTRAHFNSLIRQNDRGKASDERVLGKDRAEFFKRFSATVDPTLGASPLAQQRLQEARIDAMRQEDELRKAGKSPHLLYDPKASEFFGNQINKYVPTLKDQQDFDRRQKEAQTVPTGASAPNFKPSPDWQWSPSRHQYRDPQGNLYDVNGNRLGR